jgi:hypothetical protein
MQPIAAANCQRPQRLLVQQKSRASADGGRC